MGETLTITGGVPLCGTVDIPAAKNGVLPILAACTLCRQTVRLLRVPLLSDVDHCASILTAAGCTVRRDGGVMTVFPAENCSADLPEKEFGALRASVLFLAPVLARTGHVNAGMPGGCKLGPRPIDIHLDGLVHMGASVNWQTDRLSLDAPQGLRGADYTLRFPSVGATETLLLAAVCARGKTVLRGAACEPEIRDLADFLNACGARIVGAGESVISVTGVAALGGTTFAPLPDRIVAATAACAVASAGGSALLRRCDPFAFVPVLAALCQAGCEVELRGKSEVYVQRTGRLTGIGRIFTGVYPAFPTDAAPLLAAAILCAKSASSIEDTVFENRFSCAAGFSAMGDDVATNGHTIEISPAKGLHGATVHAPDLRGGAALALAALAAGEPTIIDQAEHIRRGYEDLAGLLGQLGAHTEQKSTAVS